MENVIEWLKEARGEIIAGLVLALLGWLYSRYRSFMKMYRLKKKELERMENDMFRFGNTKKEIESLQEALKESEAQRQDVKNQIETLQQELQRKDEALRESEAKSQEASRRIEALQSQLETSQAELQHRDEALKKSEAQRQDVQNQLETLQQELQRKNKAEPEQQPDPQENQQEPEPSPKPEPKPEPAPKLDLSEIRKILPAVDGILTRSFCIRVGRCIGNDAKMTKDVLLVRRFMKVMDMYLSCLMYDHKNQDEIDYAKSMIIISYSLIFIASIRDGINISDVENGVKEAFAINNLNFKKYDMREVISFITTAVCVVKKEYKL